MKVFRSVWKWWNECWSWDIGVCSNIDSHKWESKTEAYREPLNNDSLRKVWK